MQICLACSTSCPENSGRFCPECGAVLAKEIGRTLDPDVIELTKKSNPPSRPAADGVDGAASTARGSKTSASLVGAKVDGFSVEGVLGGGAFGTVYKGRQLGLDRVVALKVPTMEIASDPVMAKRFAREARAAARVNHPGVVSIYAVGELPDGRPYLAMQLLEGEPLDRILVDGPIAVQRALGIARQIASALSETHAADVVHRDLKPTNIMWRRDRNGDDRLTLVDFGIAVCRPGNADATRLTSGGLIGTPHYMSPEQAHGELVDTRADLYALGCLLFELVTNTTPYEGSGFEVLLAHLGRPAPRASDRNANIPESVDRLILGLMAKKPDDRIATADAVVEMIDDILDALDGPQPAKTPATPPRAKRKTASTRREGRAALPPLPPIVSDSEMLESSSSSNADTPVVVDLPARTGRLQWLAIGALAAIAVCATAFFVFDLGGNASRASGIEEEAAPITRREIFRDIGDIRLRVWVPDPFVTGRARLRAELRNKLGAPITADQLIVTIEDPEQRAIGITARPRQDNPEQFGFSYEFKQPGIYRLRVFPPEDASHSQSTFEVDLSVAAK